MARTALDVQQEFAENSGFDREIIWDLLSERQSNILKEKINKLLPEQEEGLEAVEEKRNVLFEKVWAQRKYTNRNSLSAVIYVLVIKTSKDIKALDSKEFSCHPVFRTRKCVAENANDSSNCCMIFIDEVGRVYQNWREYLQDNELPKGSMVVPTDGIYTFDESDRVNLDVYDTPASSVTRKLLAGADTTSTVAGVMAACVPVAALLTVPVTAPIMAGAAVVTLASVGYSTIRSGSKLMDRGVHEQSISIKDRQARNSWLGIVGGLVGIGASGITRAAAFVTAAGPRISAKTEELLKGINVTSVVLSGPGVANGVLDLILKYNGDEEISSLDWMQLSASLLLFTHSINNFHSTCSLIDGANDSTIHAFRRELRSRQQNVFSKICRRTAFFCEELQLNLDIVRNANNIPSKQELHDLCETYQCTFVTNDVIDETDTNEQISTARLIFSPTATHESNCMSKYFECGTLEMSCGTSIPLSEFNKRVFEYVFDEDSFETLITTIAEMYGHMGFRFLMRLAQAFIDNMLEEILDAFAAFISLESILYFMLIYSQTKYASAGKQTYRNWKTDEILEAAHNHFLALNPNPKDVEWTDCKLCDGFYTVCDI